MERFTFCAVVFLNLFAFALAIDADKWPIVRANWTSCPVLSDGVWSFFYEKFSFESFFLKKKI